MCVCVCVCVCVLKGSPPTFLHVSACLPVFSSIDLNHSHFCNRFANFNYWSSTVLYVCKCMHILNEFKKILLVFFPGRWVQEPWKIFECEANDDDDDVELYVRRCCVKLIIITFYMCTALLYRMWVFFYLFYIIALLLIFCCCLHCQLYLLLIESGCFCFIYLKFAAYALAIISASLFFLFFSFL